MLLYKAGSIYIIYIEQQVPSLSTNDSEENNTEDEEEIEEHRENLVQQSENESPPKPLTKADKKR